PAKFRVCDAFGNSVATAGVVRAFHLVQIIAGTVVSDVNDTVASTTPDAAFRWSATDQLWIFNINTKGMQADRTYVFLITLDDGSVIPFQFGVR
ncbi:MAG TPA: PxKF domain-containing protein, partial [Vicinamibacterales bacterium]|nr:PxKF domain-containing protein [Vicinamibacterales bacterium]